MKTIYVIYRLFPSTAEEGKLISIILLFIAGDILAKSFKWIYAKCFLCRICPNIARRRLAREKHKEKLRLNNGEDPVKGKFIYSCDKI